jgi:hypothetical protein
MGPLNFYLDKSMPTKTQHNTMSALVNNQRRMARRSKLKPRGEEEMSSARRSSVHHHKQMIAKVGQKADKFLTLK